MWCAAAVPTLLRRRPRAFLWRRQAAPPVTLKIGNLIRYSPRGTKYSFYSTPFSVLRSLLCSLCLPSRQPAPAARARSSIHQFHFHGVQLLPFLRHEAPGRGRRGGGGGGEEWQGPPQGLHRPRPTEVTRLLQGGRATGRRYTGTQCCRYFLHSTCRLIVVIRAYCLA